jgi:hypothetical protein
MTLARTPPHPKIKKSELAARLGVTEDTLLSADEAAVFVGLKKSSLNKLLQDGPPFYRSSLSKTAGEKWFPVADLHRYLEARSARRSFVAPRGHQAWPEARTAPIPISDPLVIVGRIAIWKKQQLQMRLKDFNDRAKDEAAYKRKYLDLLNWNMRIRGLTPNARLADRQTDQMLTRRLEKLGVDPSTPVAKPMLLTAILELIQEQHVRWSIYKDFSGVLALVGDS